ncbi:hypothetical protein DI392_13455 [Vibrio albus]|uniref:Uncharacterized protein n=8 Tax=Vibrionaceae TaxID=641 RepID=A0A1P8DPZ7_VIBPH|nr:MULTISPECIES: hypothetical protein [Gammaproteobacteria]MDW1972114.1 hypothetical protein [Vibrio sp. 945]QLK49847.1 hypothetical protein DR996_33220 [Vibrio owensii]HDY8061218.1 hypothetical protein [Vibrio vulnificus]APU90976.1 hypothetical protein [Vibrio alginolyticus]APU91201.1 hypothetical protein [Vibrio parahaemolyticus]
MLVSFLTWFLVGLQPIVLVVIIQNLIGKLLTPIALRNKASRGVYLATAAIGVPIHELSHAIAAFLFRHRITKIKFFEYTAGHGRLGYVEHQWNVLSPLQNVGLFFIGIAPLIGAGAVIYLTTKLMLPGLLDTLAWRIVEIPMGITGDPVKDAFYAVQYGISGAGIAILSVSSEPQFWLWMLISSVVAFHSTPSKADMQSAWKGAIAVGVLLTGIVFIFEAYYPLTEMVVGYWLYSVSIMSATIVFSMPWWVILLMIAMVSKR